MQNKKICKICKEEKSLDLDFYKSKGVYHSWCKKCSNFYSKAWAREHKASITKAEKARD